MMKLTLVSILISFNASLALAALPHPKGKSGVTYKTFFGQCPAKSSGMLGLMIMKEFEKAKSLKDVKEKMLHEKLDEKFFLSDYRISFNPVSQTLRINLECPEPMAKVQVYKLNGEEHFSAILSSNGKMYEPQYEILMSSEKKLTYQLPLIALSIDQVEGGAPQELTDTIQKLNMDMRKRISEIILSKKNELTIIFSLGGKATSVFMGADFWDEKLYKLTKVVGYVSKSQRYPSSINLTNPKKVVVKFSDKI